MLQHYVSLLLLTIAVEYSNGTLAEEEHPISYSNPDQHTSMFTVYIILVLWCNYYSCVLYVYVVDNVLEMEPPGTNSPQRGIKELQGMYRHVTGM